ncbi:MAG: hypothetical protein OXR68_01560, partial [Alphaproteobacteria bacterium]|nr:hypothetical protein [Alphaproteobacteria bacterium]
MRRRPSFLEFITLMLFMLIAPVGAFGDSSTVYNDLIVPDVNVEAKRREDLIGIRVTPNGGYELYMCFFDVWPQTPIKTTNLREIRRSALKAGLRKTLGFKKQDTDYPLIVIKLVFDNNYTLLEASLQRTSGQVAAFLTHSEASLALQQSNSPFYEDLTTAYKLAKQLARAEITMKKAEAKDMIRSFVEFLRNNLIRLVNNKNQPFI